MSEYLIDSKVESTVKCLSCRSKNLWGLFYLSLSLNFCDWLQLAPLPSELVSVTHWKAQKSDSMTSPMKWQPLTASIIV